MANAFDDIDAENRALTASATLATPKVNAFDDLDEVNKRAIASGVAPDMTETGGGGSFFSHAAMGAIPATGVLGGAEAGAAAGLAATFSGGPVGGAVAGGVAGASLGEQIGGAFNYPKTGAAIGAAAGGVGGFFGLAPILGGFAGGFRGGAIAGVAQNYAIEALPNSWKDPLKETLATEEKEHPYASFLGGLVPFAVTMTPFSAAGAGKATTALGRVLENKWTARVFGGAMQGGLELGSEFQNDETPDWAKIGIATGFGFIWNRPNQPIGERITKVTRAPFARYLPPEPIAAPKPSTEAGEEPPPGLTPEQQEAYRKEREARAASGLNLSVEGATPTDEALLSPEIQEQFRREREERAAALKNKDPSVAEVDAAGILGAGNTEATNSGVQKRSVAADQDAQDRARTEASITQPPPVPDFHDTVKRIRPDLVADRDKIEENLKNMIETKKKLDKINPGVADKQIKIWQDKLSAVQDELRGVYARAAEISGADTHVEEPVESEEPIKPINEDIARENPELVKRKAELETKLSGLKDAKEAYPTLGGIDRNIADAQRELAGVMAELRGEAPPAVAAPEPEAAGTAGGEQPPVAPAPPTADTDAIRKGLAARLMDLEEEKAGNGSTPDLERQIADTQARLDAVGKPPAPPAAVPIAQAAPAPAPAPALSTPQMRAAIKADVIRQLTRTGAPADVAEAKAEETAAFFMTLARRTGGVSGSAMALYEKHGANWRGTFGDGKAKPPKSPDRRWDEVKTRGKRDEPKPGPDKPGDVVAVGEKELVVASEPHGGTQILVGKPNEEGISQAYVRQRGQEGVKPLPDPVDFNAVADVVEDDRAKAAGATSSTLLKEAFDSGAAEAWWDAVPPAEQRARLEREGLPEGGQWNTLGVGQRWALWENATKEVEPKAAEPVIAQELKAEPAAQGFAVGASWESPEGTRRIEGIEDGKYLVRTGDDKHVVFYDPASIERTQHVDSENLKYRAGVKEQERQEAEREAARTHLDGFDDGMSPMEKGRAVKTLTAMVNYHGKPISRRDLIRQKIEEGARVETDSKGERVLKGKDGAFLDAKAITKTGLDYAEHLAAKGTTEAPKVEAETAPTVTETHIRPATESEINQAKRDRFDRLQQEEHARAISPASLKVIRERADKAGVSEPIIDAVNRWFHPEAGYDIKEVASRLWQDDRFWEAHPDFEWDDEKSFALFVEQVARSAGAPLDDPSAFDRWVWNWNSRHDPRMDFEKAAEPRTGVTFVDARVGDTLDGGEKVLALGVATRQEADALAAQHPGAHVIIDGVARNGERTPLKTTKYAVLERPKPAENAADRGFAEKWDSASLEERRRIAEAASNGNPVKDSGLKLAWNELSQAARFILSRHLGGATEPAGMTAEERIKALRGEDALAELRKRGEDLVPGAGETSGTPAPTPEPPKPVSEATAPATEAGKPAYGANNKLVTTERAEALRERLRQKLKDAGAQLNSGIDPEFMQIGTELAVYHMEAGVRSFGDFARTMGEYLGAKLSDIRPYLRSWYNGARDMMEDHGLDVAGLDDPDTVRIELARLLEEEAGTVGPKDTVERYPGAGSNHSDQFAAYAKWIEENGPARDNMREIIRMDERLNDGEADELLAMTGVGPGQKPEAANDPRESFIAAMKEKLAGGEKPFRSIVEARALAKAHGLEIPEGESANKTIDELIERAVVARAREIVEEGGTPEETFAKIVKLYDNQPNLATRTSTSVAEQAYSTPAPLAYVASRLAGIDRTARVLEPTAGNGMLLIEADPRKVRVNELNGARADSLKAQGYAPTRKDAAAEETFSDDIGKYDVVIGNPPFGTVREGGNAKVFSVGDFNTTNIDHAISLNVLKSMKADGKAVLIIGGVKAEGEKERAEGYQGKAKRRFFYNLLKDYNVTDVFTVSGDLYEKQGAGWPVDVIVIDGKGKSARDPLTKTPPPLLKTWDEVGNKLHDLIGRDRTPEPALAGPDSGQGIGAPEGQPGPTQGDVMGGKPVVGGEPVGVGEPQLQESEALGASGDRGEPGSEGRGNPVLEGEGRPPGEGGNVREPDIPTAPERSRSVEVESKGGQAPYEPASTQGVKLNTLLPENLRGATNESLDRLEAEHGDIDHYVANALGRKPEELGKYFSAEQIDAIGLAVSNVEKGAGFIIGDQTGIGKGRVVAAMIAYARTHGMVPIFVTQKPELYGAMWSDLHDIGWNEQLSRPINMVMTNSGIRVPLDSEALAWTAERDEARANGQSDPPRRGTFSTPQGVATAQKNLNDVLSGKTAPDVVFTTYDQMRSVGGGETPRREFLRRISPRAFLIMDEAHTAGGQAVSENAWDVKEDKAPPMSDLFREAVGKARSVMYSSATYAKNPSVMTLYSRTDMGKAVKEPKDLPNLIEQGGVPLQQVVAAMLSKAGQYLRRERSFDGVAYDHEGVPVNEERYAEFTNGLRSIFQFDTAFEAERMGLAQKAAAEAGGGTARDGSTGEAGAHSTQFASIMHNIIGQMIVAMKAEKAAERAVQALKAGEKPIITLSKTNASFIDDFVGDKGFKIGDAIDINFSNLMHRYLERTRRVTIKLGNDEKQHIMIPIEDMSPEMQAKYHDAEARLREINLDLPISPIDAMRNILQREGYTVREITGRSKMLDYSSGTPTLVNRPAGELGAAGKSVSRDLFNNGRVDALIINQSGSTGISLHAAHNVADQRRRRMIIAEADPNIDTHMQMLGRVHRTGQVIPPAYTHMSADIPAEVRPTAVLMRKMASLNANTTGATKSKFTSDAVDFLNKYGDQVIGQITNEDHDLWERLGRPRLTDDEGRTVPGAAAKATGRLTLLDPEEQQKFLDAISSRYQRQVEELNATGENDLEAQSMDLRAKVLETKEMKPATGSSPFEGPVNLEKVSVKAQGRAMEPKDAVDRIASVLSTEPGEGEPGEQLARLARAGETAQEKTVAKALKDEAAYRKEYIDTLKDKKAKEKAEQDLTANRAKFRSYADMAPVGSIVDLNIKGQTAPALVIGFRKADASTNPLALSTWEVTFSLPSGLRSLSIPLSRLGEEIKISPNYEMTHAEFASRLNEARKEGREDRYMVTGNILRGFSMLRGQIINHTMEDGSIRPAMLMPRGWDEKGYQKTRPVEFDDGAHVMRYMDKINHGMSISADGITIRKEYGNYFDFIVPAAKRTGGKFYTDSTVRSVFDRWQKRGNDMVANVRGGKAEELIDALRGVGAKFVVRKDQDLVDSLREKTQESDPDHEPGGDEYEQRTRTVKRGGVFFPDDDGSRPIVTLIRNASDVSTIFHEGSHTYIKILEHYGSLPDAPQELKDDLAIIRDWSRIRTAKEFDRAKGWVNAKGRPKDFAEYQKWKTENPNAIHAIEHEKLARAYETYCTEDRAESRPLAKVFERIKKWMLDIYRSVKAMDVQIDDRIRGVFDRMLDEGGQTVTIAPERERGPTLADIHEADANETSPGPQAGAARERVIAEAERKEQELHPEIADEHETARQAIEAEAAARAEQEGTHPSGEVGLRDQEAGSVDGGGAEAGTEPAGGGGSGGAGPELGGGGNVGPEGASAGGPEQQRPVSQQPSGPAVGSGGGGAGASSAGTVSTGPVPHPEPRDTFSRDSRNIDKAGNINLDRIAAPEDVKRVIRDAALANDDFIGDRRGVVTWGETVQLAEALGMDATKLLQRKIGQAFNASEAWAARKLLVQSAYAVKDAMNKAADGSDADLLAYAQARERHKLIQAQVAGMTAEAGRALNIFAKVVGEGGDVVSAINKIVKDGTGVELFQLRKEAKLGATLDNPEAISRFMNATRKPNFGDMVLEYWINNLISGPATHTTYAIANELLSLTRAIPETLVASAVGPARKALMRAMGKTVDDSAGVYAGEAQKRLGAIFGKGTTAGARSAYESFLAGSTTRLPGESGSIEAPFRDGRVVASPTLEPGTFGGVVGLKEGFVTGATVLKAAGDEGSPRWGVAHSSLGAIPDISTPIGVLPVGTIMRMPSRAISGIHAFFRVSNYLMEINALAFRQAKEEGITDLSKFAARVEELKRNPTEEMMKQARDTATNATLMGPAGPITQKLSALINTPFDLPGIGPIKLLKFIDPFVHISSNIIKEGLMARTPVGLLSRSLREDIAGKNGNAAADMAAARMLCGTMLAATTVMLASAGFVNGSGPGDRRLAAVWKEAGNLPHSIRIGDMWYSMNRLGPLGLLMGVAADMYDVAHSAENHNWMKAGAMLQEAFTHNILDESFLRGPSDAIKAISDPWHEGERWITNMGTSFLPFSVGMAQLTRGADPYSRQARSFMDVVKAKVPGISETLLPRISIWGQPVPNPDAVIASGLTAIYEKRQNEDPVNQALMKLGIGIGLPKRDIRGVQLTDQQWTDFAMLSGRMTKSRLDALVGSQVFMRSPGHVQHDLIVTTVRQCRETAANWMMARHPEIPKQSYQNKVDRWHREDEYQ